MLWLTQVGVLSAGSLVLSHGMDNLRLWSAMAILEEPLPDATIVDSAAELPFRAVDDGESIRGLTGSYWVRLSVSNPETKAITWYLHHQNSWIAGFEPLVLSAGIQTPQALRRLPHRSPLLEITTPAQNTQEIYVKRSAPTRLVFRADEWRAWSPYEFQRHIQRDHAFKGVVYGIVLAMVLYNLFLFVSLRDPSHGYYVLCALLYALTWMAWDGSLEALLPFPQPRLFEPALFGALGGIAAMQFLRLFLQTSQREPRIDRLLRFIMVLCAGGAVAAIFTSWGPEAVAASGLTAIVIPIVLWIAWRRGFRAARFLVLGWSLFAVGFMALLGLHLSGVSVQGVPLTLIPAVHAAELLLMSFALADRVKLLEQQNKLIEQRYRKAIEQSHEELERKIVERTRELESARRQAEALASHDPLTGLFNRRAFWKKAQVQIEHAQRYQRPLSVIMIDIDHFKHVNDSYGHAAGDAVIGAIAAMITGNLRATDITARLGGEEFVVMLPETDAEAARHLAERLRQGIAAMPISAAGADIRVAASLGVSALKPEDSGLDVLLSRADAALYAAKNAGRNQLMMG